MTDKEQADWLQLHADLARNNTCAIQAPCDTCGEHYCHLKNGQCKDCQGKYKPEVK